MRPILAIAIAVFSASFALAEEKLIEIPLKDIWAARMPGTQNIRELEPRTEGDNREFGPLMHTVIRMMQGDSSKAWGRPDAGPGFPVPGAGIAALHRVYDVIVDNAGERPETVPAGEVSVVFFARRSGQHCYLEKVERDGNVITLTYRFHVHRTAHVAGYLALIPLGVLEPGEYEVRHVQLPVARPPGEAVAFTPPMEGERLKRSVSQPFYFEVQ